MTNINIVDKRIVNEWPCKKLKEELKLFKIKVIRKEKDLFLPRGHFDLTIRGTQENMKLFIEQNK
tara:strand:+ start:95 stop:289 length:195 start_codon:yes stop_codon:yes gene_type:complete